MAIRTGFTLTPRVIPANIPLPGGSFLDSYGQAKVAGIVLEPQRRVQNPDSIPGAKAMTDYGQARSVGQVLVPREGGFRSVAIKKGYIVNRRTGKMHPFMFNPTEIGREDAWEWAEHKVPGASHPILSGGTGGGRSISFTLYFDGDRGRSDLREKGPSTRDNKPVAAGNPLSLDISDELSFYQSYTYPHVPADLYKDRGPDRLVLNYGTFFKGIECVMTTCAINITAFTPMLEPMRATVRLILKETIRKTVANTDIFPESVGSAELMDGIVGGEV